MNADETLKALEGLAEVLPPRAFIIKMRKDLKLYLAAVESNNTGAIAHFGMQLMMGMKMLTHMIGNESSFAADYDRAKQYLVDKLKKMEDETKVN